MPTVRGVDLALTDTGAGTAFFWGHGFASSRGSPVGSASGGPQS